MRLVRRAGPRGLALAAAALLCAPPARAYRPFFSTDADVAVYRTIELELGYFGLQRQNGTTHGQTPQVVVNYGFLPGFEAVGQFYLDEPPGESPRVFNGELSVKNVLRRGVLQDQPGPSVAMESAVLVPGSAGESQPRFGWEESGILSHRLGDVTLHWNASLGVDQTAGLPLAVFGLIGEKPLVSGLRAVGELFSEEVRTLAPDNSVLVGLIWEPGWREAAFDVGVRRGLSASAPLWAVTAGVSIPFALDALRPARGR